ncbi:MAG: L,D-transpeptidase, partial [Eubacterium sp.]|nr:L,D-transpeptidase [Eubacterium sp.]
TPSGIYFMKFKELDHILTGERDEEGNPEYETPCSYWMPFNGGIGFHDAWWRGAFGGEIYTYDGSHGCINMPLEAAGQLYEVITTEMPIVIYYSKGCPFEPERNKLLGLVDPETEAAEAAAAEDGSAEESSDDGSYDESYDDSGES